MVATDEAPAVVEGAAGAAPEVAEVAAEAAAPVAAEAASPVAAAAVKREDQVCTKRVMVVAQVWKWLHRGEGQKTGLTPHAGGWRFLATALERASRTNAVMRGARTHECCEWHCKTPWRGVSLGCWSVRKENTGFRNGCGTMRKWRY